MKQKICFIVTDAISFNFLMKGQLEFIQSLNKYDITLISGGEHEQLEFLKSRGVGKIKYIPFSRTIKLLNDISCLLKLIIYLFNNKQDIVVYSTPKAMLLGSLASWLTFQPSRIAIVRGRAYENYNGLKRKLFECLDRITIKTSSKILFISHSLRNAYLQGGLVKTSSSKVVGNGSSNGIDIEWVNGSIEEKVIQKLKADINYNPKRDFIAITVGRICIDKGIVELKEIFESLKKHEHFKIICVGKTEDSHSEYLIKELSKCNNFFHFNQTSDVRPFFHLADLHLFLSHREGFGNVAIEAASFNVPSFGYNVVGVTDSIKNGVTGRLFPFKDSLSISEAIIPFLDSNKASRGKYPEMKRYTLDSFNSVDVWLAYEKEFSNEKAL
ncbi:glycosyltransferase [Psychrobium sp. 1_MG-2023]|uniref:glycosyltransferase n=1 Tax=Psychrobium sp. 1_MG-2023 TaxID=3062624 RepID=UPI000C325275|nr:glycosyltransferase [Psychrobium sp. 1_MG-2023]MDP2562115.1 glycosyltransferase [Psychrobium sp. 1_MG-2023]PKF55714.1 hypothetical protein CW748_12735 [Alteromonadales bacterium alter-6D02]